MKWGQRRHDCISGEIERMNEVTIQAGLRPPLACDEGHPEKSLAENRERHFSDTMWRSS